TSMEELVRDHLLSKLKIKKHLSSDEIQEVLDLLPTKLSTKINESARKLAKKRVDRQDISVSGAGVSKDREISEQNLEEFKALDKDKQDRIKKAAKAYREFADASLRYMVEKGRLSKEQYDLIKENNAYY